MTVKKDYQKMIIYYRESLYRLFFHYYLDICTLRLDFESFTTIAGTGTLIDSTSACQDSFEITNHNGAGIPNICGKNSGHHSEFFFSILFYTQNLIFLFFFWFQFLLKLGTTLQLPFFLHLESMSQEVENSKSKLLSTGVTPR